MLTIDEAIAKYQEKAEYFKTTTNVAYALELKQLAEWLEELKDLREMRYRVKNMIKIVEEIMKRMKQELSKAEDRKEQYGYANNLSAMYNMVDMEEQRVSTIQEMLDIVQAISSEKHEQLAEWLEELKDHRERECNHINEALYDKGYSDGYNKAIDDFVKEICKMIVQSEKNGNYRFYAVEIKQAIADLAEQLKAGGVNENYNKEESR